MPCPILAGLSSAPEVSIPSPAPTFPNIMSANLLLILGISIQMPLLWQVFLTAILDRNPCSEMLCCAVLLMFPSTALITLHSVQSFLPAIAMVTRSIRRMLETESQGPGTQSLAQGPGHAGKYFLNALLNEKAFLHWERLKWRKISSVGIVWNCGTFTHSWWGR